MASNNQDQVWPLPKFYFMVDFGRQLNIPFQEVSGLDAETQIIEYRHGNSPEFSTIKMPGLQKVGNVTMKKGVFPSDKVFFDWYDKIKMNTIERNDVTIKLLDESGKPTMVWVLKNAWPCKISSSDIRSEGSEVAIESIELAYETLSISNA